MRINLLVALGIVILDMRKVRRILERGMIPVEIPQPAVEMWVAAAYVADIAFEVLHVDRVEADEGCEEPDVDFGHVVAKEERSTLLFQLCLCAVQGVEEHFDVLLIGLLGAGNGQFSIQEARKTYVAKPAL